MAWIRKQYDCNNARSNRNENISITTVVAKKSCTENGVMSKFSDNFI
jgi:hypothetical protein